MHIGRGRKAKFADKGSKRQFQEELKALVSPHDHAINVDRSSDTATERPPTMEVLLNEAGRQVMRFGEQRPLTVLCGVASFAALRNLSSGPSWLGGTKWKLSKYLPPYDIVVMLTRHLSHSGDLY